MCLKATSRQRPVYRERNELMDETTPTPRSWGYRTSCSANPADYGGAQLHCQANQNAYVSVKTRGLFTVRARWQQYGVRVVCLGHISVRSQSSQKNERPLAIAHRIPIFFHHRGCPQDQNMTISVRSLWKQSGVRVSPAGHVRRGVQPPKTFTTSTRYLPPRSLFHLQGWRQPP